jgi:hypothetical protein
MCRESTKNIKSRCILNNIIIDTGGISYTLQANTVQTYGPQNIPSIGRSRAKIAKQKA